MPKALSMDIRVRAVGRVERGESVRSVAAALEVAPSSVVKWSQRHRQTGSAAPAKLGGYRPRSIGGAHAVWLRARIASGRPFTLRVLVSELAERGLQVDVRTVWSWVHREGLSFKKKPAAK